MLSEANEDICSSIKKSMYKHVLTFNQYSNTYHQKNDSNKQDPKVSIYCCYKTQKQENRALINRSYFESLFDCTLLSQFIQSWVIAENGKPCIMVIRVVEFSRGVYKIKQIFVRKIKCQFTNYVQQFPLMVLIFVQKYI